MSPYLGEAIFENGHDFQGSGSELIDVVVSRTFGLYVVPFWPWQETNPCPMVEQFCNVTYVVTASPRPLSLLRDLLEWCDGW